jgi:hypothetical protein
MDKPKFLILKDEKVNTNVYLSWIICIVFDSSIAQLFSIVVVLARNKHTIVVFQYKWLDSEWGFLKSNIIILFYNYIISQSTFLSAKHIWD